MVPFSGATLVHIGGSFISSSCVVKSMNMLQYNSHCVRSKLTSCVTRRAPSGRYVKEGSPMWSQVSPLSGWLSTTRKSYMRSPWSTGKVTTKAASLMLLMFMAMVKLETPSLGSLSQRTLLVSPSATKRLISMSSVMEVGTSSQSVERPALMQALESGCPSGTRLISSKPMPSSTNSKSFQSTPPEWGMPSRMPSRVSMAPMHLGPMLRTASRSSVLIQELFPPGSPSNNPSRLSRTTAEFEPFTQALAYMSPVAQSSLTASSNNAKSYSKRSSKVNPPHSSAI